MSLNERILDILQRWTAARERGESPAVEQLCADCPELAGEVRGRIKMLQAMEWLENSDGGSEPPPPKPHPKRPSTHDLANEPTIGLTPGAQQPPPEIGSYVRYVGDYELLAEIARGGMGVVFKARQVRLKRVVALKMILAGRLASENEVRRFHTEAESAANLEHPHIVPIYEVGEQKGLHYFSMGYVDGASLAVRLADGPLPAREAAAILRPVAEAVHYAHQQGVIHRDLKPGNILIDKQGQPRVTDFGLAKRVSADASEMTGTGQILGTASYMPPEQALGQPSLVREPADIYSLGAVLYAMLTGRPPFQADNPVETLRQVIEREPVPPRQLNPAIPADLETICLKCLEKAASRRYATAQEVADELGRFLEGKPIHARPVSTLNRAWRWCQRNRTIASLLTAVAASLVIGIAVSSYFAVRETVAHGKAQESARQANRQAANLALNEATNLCEAGEANVGLLWMARAHGLAIEAGDADLADASRAMISGWLSRVPRLETSICELDSTVGRFGAQDASVVVARNLQNNVELCTHDATRGDLLSARPGLGLRTFSLAVSEDRTRCLVAEGERYGIWSLEKGDWAAASLAIAGRPSSADFSLDGKLLATATDEGRIQVWNTATGKLSNEFLEPQAGYSPRVCRIRFDRAGASLWIAGTSKTLSRRHVADGRSMMTPLNLGYPVFSMTLDRRFNRLAIGDMNRGIRLIDLNTAPPKELAQVPSQMEYDLAFHPAGGILLAGGRGLGNEARFWELPSLKPASAALSAPGTIVGVQFSNTGNQSLVSHLHGVELWRTPSSAILASSTPLKAPLGLTHYSLAARRLVAVDSNDERLVAVLSVPEGKQTTTLGPFESPIRFVAADAAGQVGVLVDADHRLLVANLKAKNWRFASGKVRAIPKRVQISSNAKSAYLAMPDRTMEVWSLERPARITLNELDDQAIIAGAAFDSTGDRLALCDESNSQVHVVDLVNHQRHVTLPVGQPSATIAAFHPDGRTLFLGRYGGRVEGWDLTQAKRTDSLGKHDSSIYDIKVSPNGKFAVTSGTDQAVRIWNLDRGTLQCAPVRNIGRIYDTIEISPDSRLAALHSQAMQSRIVHLGSGRLVSPQIDLQANSEVAMHFSPDSTLLVSAGYGNSRPQAHFMPDVPQETESLQLLVSAWTGMALDGDDVRVLPRDEWRKRQEQLTALGWKDADTPAFAPAAQPLIELRELPPPALVSTNLAQPLEVHFSRDGKRVAAGSNNVARVWDVPTQSLVRDFGEPQSGSRVQRLTQDGRQLITGGGFGLKWWDVDTGELKRTVRVGSVTDIALSPDENLIAVGLAQGREAKVIEASSGEVLLMLKSIEPIPSLDVEPFGQGKVAFSPDGKYLATAWGGKGGPTYSGVESILSIWELPSGRLIASGVADESRLRNLEFSPDGKWIAAPCHARGRVKIWPLPEAKAEAGASPEKLAPPRTIFVERGQYSCAFSPDNRYLAFCGSDGESSVSLVKLDTFETIDLPIPPRVIDLDFSRAAAQLATLSEDGTLGLWNLESLLQKPVMPNGASSMASAMTAQFLLELGKELVESQYGKLKALPVLQRALELQQQEVAANPGDLEAQARLGEIYFQMGRDRYQAPRDNPERNGYLDDFQRSVDALEIFVAHPEATPQHARQLLNPLGSLGLLKNDVNLLKQTLDRARTLSERFGDHADLKYSRARLMHYISHLTRASDPAESLRLNDEAVALFDEVYAIDQRPEAASFIGLCIGYQAGNVAKLPLGDPRRQRDKASIPRAIEVLEQACRDYPQYGFLARNRIVLLHNAANLDLGEGKIAEAAPQFERAAKLAQSLIDQGHTRVPGIWDQMRYSHGDAAVCFARAEDDRAAWEKAVLLAEHVTKGLAKENREFGYAELYTALAVAKFRLGNAAAAKTAIDKAIEISKQRRASELFWRAAILDKLGDKEQAAADWKEAEEWLKANPTTEPYLLALAVIDQRLAGTYRTASP